MTIRNLAELFLAAIAKPRPDGLLHRKSGAYEPVSTAELASRVERLAAALRHRGVAPGDRVALLAENGPDWPVVDFATLAVGAVLVPLYPALPAEATLRRLAASDARWLFVQGRGRLDALLARRGELPELQRLVLLDGVARGDGVDHLESLLQSGADVAEGTLQSLAQERRPTDPATLIYSADLGAEPRGALLTHGEMAHHIVNLGEVLPIDDRQTAMCALPLATVVERTLHFLYFHRGAAVAYPESPATVDRDLAQARPQVFAAVPDVFKRLMNRVYAGVQRGSEEQQARFRSAVAVGRDALPYRLEGDLPPGEAGRLLAAADQEVFRAIRQHLGGRAEIVLAVGRPLSEGWLTFLWAAGIPVFEAYCPDARTPLLTANAPGAIRLGTVGRPLTGVEVRLSDVGELDHDGFLTLTGHRRERFVSAGGGWISPPAIEALLEASHFIRHALVVGRDGKPPAALLAPDFGRLDAAAEAHGVDFTSRRELLRDPRVRGLFAGEVANANQGLEAEQQVEAWELLADELSFAAGELDPFGMIRRPVLHRQHAALIEQLLAAEPEESRSR